MTTPTVQGALDKIAARNYVMNNFRLMGWAEDKERLREALDLIHEDDPEVFLLIVRYLTTGTQAARERIDRHVSEVLSSVMVVLAKTHGTKDNCPAAWSPTFSNTLSKYWNALNVMEESGCYHEDTEEYLLWTNSTEMLMSFAYEQDRQRDDAYWRGLGAATLVQIINNSEIFYTEREQIEQLRGFINLAGTTPYIKPLMKIAVERVLIDADILGELMEDRDAISTAVGSGVL